jgi:hypothetical protein
MYYQITNLDETWYVQSKFRSLEQVATLLEALETGRVYVGQPPDLKVVTIYEDHDYPRINVDARKIP